MSSRTEAKVVQVSYSELWVQSNNHSLMWSFVQKSVNERSRKKIICAIVNNDYTNLKFNVFSHDLFSFVARRV